MCHSCCDQSSGINQTPTMTRHIIPYQPEDVATKYGREPTLFGSEVLNNINIFNQIVANMGVSINGGTQKWLVYEEKTHENG